MTIKFTRGEVTIPNKLYGDKTYPAYLAGGLAIAKVGAKAWRIFKQAEGVEVYHRIYAGTLTGAKFLALKLLALPIDWTLPRDDKEQKEAFCSHVKDIRAIGQEASAK